MSAVTVLDLSRGEQRLLLVLNALAGLGFTVAYYETLATHVKQTPSHVKECVATLKAAGLVVVADDGGGRGKKAQVSLSNDGATLARALAGGPRS